MSNFKEFLKNDKWLVAILIVVLVLALINSTAFFGVLETVLLLIIGIVGSYIVMRKGVEITTK